MLTQPHPAPWRGPLPTRPSTATPSLPRGAEIAAVGHNSAAPVWPNNSFNPRPAKASLVRPGSASRTIVAARPYKACLRGRG